MKRVKTIANSSTQETFNFLLILYLYQWLTIFFNDSLFREWDQTRTHMHIQKIIINNNVLYSNICIIRCFSNDFHSMLVLHFRIWFFSDPALFTNSDQTTDGGYVTSTHPSKEKESGVRGCARDTGIFACWYRYSTINPSDQIVKSKRGDERKHSRNTNETSA